MVKPVLLQKRVFFAVVYGLRQFFPKVFHKYLVKNCRKALTTFAEKALNVSFATPA